ncbi:MAG: twin-arginine translocation signal domain-containing protein [Chthoniobacteraceae bacterium]
MNSLIETPGFPTRRQFLGRSAVGIATALGAWLKSAAAQMEAADV